MEGLLVRRVRLRIDRCVLFVLDYGEGDEARRLYQGLLIYTFHPLLEALPIDPKPTIPAALLCCCVS